MNTDLLLERIAGRSEIEILTFEDTDLSDRGVRHFSSFPNLKEVSFNWVSELNENTIQPIVACKKLRRLEMHNDEDLINILRKRMPNCEIGLHWKNAE